MESGDRGVVSTAIGGLVDTSILVPRGLPSSSECLLEISGITPPGRELKSPLDSFGDG
jgi:hypothetical protein